jgi:cytochrome o ubiquinol oxidase subunit IV
MENNLKTEIKSGEGTLALYIVGFVSSILLTLAAYVLVLIHVNAEHGIISHEVLIPLILILAVAQLIVQLFSFLHLGSGSGKGWKIGALVSTIILVLIIVLGSLWIMQHLNYNMTPDQMNQYIQNQQGF